jgi:predicted CXXCH cytochrome family protein
MSMRIRPAGLLAAAALVTAATLATRVVLSAQAAQADGSGTPAVVQQAGVVGQGTCAECHDAVAAQFDRSAHGRLPDHARHGQQAGCESCHGPGSVHAGSGNTADIRSFRSLDAREASRACLTCHQGEQGMAWRGSDHAMSDVSCTSCHRIHQSREAAPGLMGVEGRPRAHATAPAPKGSLAKREPELCFTCHAELRAKFSASSHHPVREGRVTCSSCHDVHGSSEEHMLRTEEGPNALCHTCHASKQGPFVFEHAPVEESCMTCHDPHGTVANNLLKQGEPFLCLQCHEMHFHNARVSPSSPFFLPSGGSTNPNGATGFQRAFGTRCTTCHTKVHGSDNPSQGVSGGGKALIR